MQLTYIVSLLRGVAIEWFSSMETRTGCLGDWTTFASSHAGTLWIVNPCVKGTCTIAANDSGQDDYPRVF